MKQSQFSILYAEDDDKIREKYVKFLNSYFENVYEASNGQEALDLYGDKRPDIIILDINMPIIDGLQVAKKIREKDRDTQLIILSAYSDREKLLFATELFLTKYIVKPIQSLEFEKILLGSIEYLHTLADKEEVVALDGGYSWNKNENILCKNSKVVKLTQKEMLLLKLFCSNENHIFSNIDIMNYVWEDDVNSDFNTNKLRVVFSKLKTKLSFNLFHSIYNVGYKIKLHRNI